MWKYVLFFLDATGVLCTGMRGCGMFDGRKGELVTQKMFLVVWKHHARVASLSVEIHMMMGKFGGTGLRFEFYSQ